MKAGFLYPSCTCCGAVFCFHRISPAFTFRSCLDFVQSKKLYEVHAGYISVAHGIYIGHARDIYRSRTGYMPWKHTIYTFSHSEAVPKDARGEEGEPSKRVLFAVCFHPLCTMNKEVTRVSEEGEG